jgi:hypothetical protein
MTPDFQGYYGCYTRFNFEKSIDSVITRDLAGPVLHISFIPELLIPVTSDPEGCLGFIQELENAVEKSNMHVSIVRGIRISIRISIGDIQKCTVCSHSEIIEQH